MCCREEPLGRLNRSGVAALGKAEGVPAQGIREASTTVRFVCHIPKHLHRERERDRELLKTDYCRTTYQYLDDLESSLFLLP